MTLAPRMDAATASVIAETSRTDATRCETEAGRSLAVLLRQALVGGSAAHQISDRCGLAGVDVPLGLASAFQELGEGPVGLGMTTMVLPAARGVPPVQVFQAARLRRKTPRWPQVTTTRSCHTTPCRP